MRARATFLSRTRTRGIPVPWANTREEIPAGLGAKRDSCTSGEARFRLATALYRGYDG